LCLSIKWRKDNTMTNEDEQRNKKKSNKHRWLFDDKRRIERNEQESKKWWTTENTQRKVPNKWLQWEQIRRRKRTTQKKVKVEKNWEIGTKRESKMIEDKKSKRAKRKLKLTNLHSKTSRRTCPTIRYTFQISNNNPKPSFFADRSNINQIRFITAV